MSAIEEIKESCLTKLTVSERDELIRWLREQDDDWDRQIEKDAAAGKLDHLFDEADRDFQAGRCREL